MNVIHKISSAGAEAAASLYEAAATVFALPPLEGLDSRNSGYQPEWSNDQWGGPFLLVADWEEGGYERRRVDIETPSSHRFVRTEWTLGRLKVCEVVFPGGSDHAANTIVEALAGESAVFLLRGPRALEHETISPLMLAEAE